MIQASHSWSGFAGLNFAGFVDTFTSAVQAGSTGYANWQSGGSWSASGKWSAGGFAPGDLVVVALTIATTATPPGYLLETDYANQSGITTVYCPCKCVAALANTGAPANPMVDTAHWTPWDFNVVGGAEPSSPTGWPGTVGSRSVGAEVSGESAWLELTITDEFANFPPINESLGTPPFNFAGDYLNYLQSATAAAFTRTWAINRYTGAQTYAESATPSSAQAALMFPFVPTAIGVAGINAQNTGNQVTNKFSFLTAWAFGANSVSFTFAVWPNEGWPGLGTTPNPWGAVPAASTITQTIAVSDGYDLSDAASDTAALLSATSFGAMAWRTLATCCYTSSGDGSITVTTSSIGSTASTNTTCTGVPANAATGYAGISLANGVTWSMSTALVDVCGPYCTRTYDCTAAEPTVTCVNGTVDGYAPVTLAVPSLPTGETSVTIYLFPGGSCA